MPQDANPATTRVRRRVAFAVIAIALLLVLLITPPLVNVDRYRHRIAQTMSDSLGRPVHIDDVKLHLLPIPSLELRNVVISEDPAFGAEPTIRANSVVAILRPSSLWRRRIEFSTIRFGVDENGAGPSVNLVRNAAGRWNLDSVFMQAAHVPTAPTAQRKAGPSPRFPYIEATAARINLKLGNEKMPFSLTEADFALWLPEPDQWHVRLKGRPTRTDANLSETGLLQLEGTLQRAASMAQVPVDLHLTWTGAQLGEGTALLTGSDLGWRGTATVDAALKGPLANAQLGATLQLSGLRRDFIPARALDLTITCQAHATVTDATLENPVCTLPTPVIPGPAAKAGEPVQPDEPGSVRLQAARLDLTSRAATDLRFSIRAPDAWLLDWARLLSPDIPRDENPSGSVDGSLLRVAASPRQPAFWTGVLQGSIFAAAPEQQTDSPDPDPAYSFTLTGSPTGLDVAPVNLTPNADSPLALSGNLNGTGYSLHLAGFASAQQVFALAAKLPPLEVGLQPFFAPRASVAGDAPSNVQHAASPPAPLPTSLPTPLPTPLAAPLPAPSSTPQRLDLTCARLWSSSQQTCTATPPANTPLHPHTRAGRR